MTLSFSSDPNSDSIELVAGRPISALPALDHLSVEARTPAIVDRIHLRAVCERLRVVPPRILRGRWRCVIFDPDGYKIEIFALIDVDAARR